jgi:hypothetical protein
VHYLRNKPLYRIVVNPLYDFVIAVMDAAAAAASPETSSIGGACPYTCRVQPPPIRPKFLSDMKYGFTAIKHVIIAAFDHHASAWNSSSDPPFIVLA